MTQAVAPKHARIMVKPFLPTCTTSQGNIPFGSLSVGYDNVGDGVASNIRSMFSSEWTRGEQDILHIPYVSPRDVLVHVPLPPISETKAKATARSGGSLRFRLAISHESMSQI